jgi:hypothetical protein
MLDYTAENIQGTATISCTGAGTATFPQVSGSGQVLSNEEYPPDGAYSSQLNVQICTRNWFMPVSLPARAQLQAPLSRPQRHSGLLF